MNRNLGFAVYGTRGKGVLSVTIEPDGYTLWEFSTTHLGVDNNIACSGERTNEYNGWIEAINTAIKEIGAIISFDVY